MWDPVVSGVFWKQHPGCRVRSCSLLPDFKAWAKHLVAAGWVISSWAGMRYIGRAPSPWGKQLHPHCLPHAHHLLHMWANWISRAVSPVPLGSTIFALRGWEPASSGAGSGQLQVGGEAWRSCSVTDAGLCCPPHCSFPLLCPRTQSGELLKLEHGVQANTFFNPCRNLVWSCNWNGGEEFGLDMHVSSPCCNEPSGQLTADALGMLGVLLRHSCVFSVICFQGSSSPMNWRNSCSPVFSLCAANNSSAELWNKRRNKHCLSSEPARRFLCYWFVCMYQYPSSGLLSSPISWSVRLASLSLCINKSARLFAGM